MAPEPSVKPKDFKLAISKYRPEFRGNDQQDAQEFLTFLIDGLHEDVNLVLDKKAFEYPEVKDKEVWKASTEYWSLHFARNWSLFTFLFTGQLGSELICKGCNKESWSFENLMALPLPITINTASQINIIVVPLCARLQELLDCNKDKEVEVRKYLSQIQMVSFALNHNATVENAIGELYKLGGIDIRPKSEFTAFEVCGVNYGKVSKVFQYTTKIEMVETYSQCKELFAFEMLTEKGRKYITTSIESKIHPENIPPQDDPIETHSEIIINRTTKDTCDKYSSFSASSYQITKAQKPKEFFIHIMNRQIIYNQKYLWQQFEPLLCGSPLLVQVTPNLTNFELYDRIWEAACIYLDPKSPFQEKENLWWYQKKTSPKDIEKKYPFILRFVSYRGDFCSKCLWSNRCLGCTINPSIEKISVSTTDYIAIDWYAEVFNKDYITLKDPIKHSSVESVKQFLQKPEDIDFVLNTFTSSEELPKTRCSNCRAVGPHLKRLSIFRLPKILILHFKRYKEKYEPYFDLFSLYAKNNALINFPFENLSMDKYLNSESEDLKKGYKYDLYAIIV